jgi:hypothetical protein
MPTEPFICFKLIPAIIRCRGFLSAHFTPRLRFLPVLLPNPVVCLPSSLYIYSRPLCPISTMCGQDLQLRAKLLPFLHIISPMANPPESFPPTRSTLLSQSGTADLLCCCQPPGWPVGQHANLPITIHRGYCLFTVAPQGAHAPPACVPIQPCRRISSVSPVFPPLCFFCSPPHYSPSLSLPLNPPFQGEVHLNPISLIFSVFILIRPPHVFAKSHTSTAPRYPNAPPLPLVLRRRSYAPETAISGALCQPSPPAESSVYPLRHTVSLLPKRRPFSMPSMLCYDYQHPRPDLPAVPAGQCGNEEI